MADVHSEDSDVDVYSRKKPEKKHNKFKSELGILKKKKKRDSSVLTTDDHTKPDQFSKKSLKNKKSEKRTLKGDADESHKKKKLKHASDIIKKRKTDDDLDDEIMDDSPTKDTNFEDADEDAGSDSDEEGNKEEYAAMREEIANMPFEDLIKLKERLGTKARVLPGNVVFLEAVGEHACVMDLDWFDHRRYKQAMHRDRPPGTKGNKRKFKRENKNRPMETSSKRRVSTVREVVSIKKKVSRDPRFDDLSGDYNEDLFSKAYSFLGDIKVRERETVKKELKEVTDTEKRQELHYLLNRMKQQEMATEMKQKRQELEKKWKEKEKERVKEGKKPFYLKKVDLRKLELAEKYRDLKKSGKVDNYLSKKRKKTASKEKKKLPLPAKQFGFT